MSSVKLVDIVRQFDGTDTPALDHINLEIKDGETVSIVGPSGCGKSTLLKIIAGLERPNSGKIYYNEQDVTSLAARERGVGMVFQDYALYPARAGEGNMNYFFETHRSTEAERQRRLHETAELMGLGFEQLLDRKADTLSGGEQQRVGIARCIVRDPNVFLMDEPICNLDAKLRERTRIEIKRLVNRFGITTLYITHDQQEAIFMSDRIVVMRSGRIEQFGCFDDLYYSPANLFVATFIGTPSINILPAIHQTNRLVVGEVELILPSEKSALLPVGPLRLGVRPEGWVVSRELDQGLTLSVSHTEYLFAERAGVIHGRFGESTVRALVKPDALDRRMISLTPDWAQAYFFSSTSEEPLLIPGVPSLF